MRRHPLAGALERRLERERARPARAPARATISPWRVTTSGAVRPGSPRRASCAARRSTRSSSGACGRQRAATSTQRASASSAAACAAAREAGGRPGSSGEQVLEQVALHAVAVGKQQLLRLDVRGARLRRREVDVAHHASAPRERLVGRRAVVARGVDAPRPRRRCGRCGSASRKSASAMPRRARSAAWRATKSNSLAVAGRPRRSTSQSRSWCVGDVRARVAEHDARSAPRDTQRTRATYRLEGWSTTSSSRRASSGVGDSARRRYAARTEP